MEHLRSGGRRDALRLLLWVALVGLALAGCSSSLPDGGGVVPPPGKTPTWRSADVGVVEIPGSVVLAAGDLMRVRAAGRDIWDEVDSFHFVYTEFEGDVTVVARVSHIDAPDAWAKAGVMIRAGLSASAAHGLMSIAPVGAAEFIRRTATGEESSSTVAYGAALPTWVRLERVGDEVIAATSVDGANWTEVDRVGIELDDVVLVGLAVTSRTPSAVAEAMMGGVRVTGPGGEVPPPPPDPEEPIDTPSPGAWVCPTAPLTPAYAPTLYVATTGNDGNDGRSPDRPLRTLQRAASLAGPGDVVWVRGGVYTAEATFNRAGRADAPIVFESYPGECAVLDGAGLTRDRRIAFLGASHYVFRNFVVRNSPMEGIYLSGSHDNVISNVRAHHNYYSGITNSNGDRNLFAYVITHDNRDDSGGDADGISISSGRDNRVQYCMAYDNSDDGVDTWRSVNTLVEYCVSFRNGFTGGDGNGFKAGSSMVVYTVVRHSVAFGNRTNGFDFNMGGNVTFDQNTSFGNGGYGFVASSGATVRNNLSFANGAGAWAGDGTQARNSWNLGITVPPFVSTDSTHVDFLSLVPGSPAVDAGIPIGLPFTGSAPDLGALPLGQTLGSFLGVLPADIRR